MFTPAMKAAYERGRELSRVEHGKPSTQIKSQLGEEFITDLFGGPQEGMRVLAWKPPPDELVEEYTNEYELIAFLAGWVDNQLNCFAMREMLEASQATTLQ